MKISIFFILIISISSSFAAMANLKFKNRNQSINEAMERFRIQWINLFNTQHLKPKLENNFADLYLNQDLGSNNNNNLFIQNVETTPRFKNDFVVIKGGPSSFQPFVGYRNYGTTINKGNARRIQIKG